jgi:predicted O-linked N-acetylglucosamine transferase (SPINDLY family)
MTRGSNPSGEGPVRRKRHAARSVAPTASAVAASSWAEGLALHRAGRLAEAEERYRRALDSDPGHFEARHHLGIIHYQRGEHIAAIRQIDAALVVNRDVAAAHNNRGVALAALERSEQALASYDRAIALAPNYVDALINRGNTLKDLQRFEAALASYDRAIALVPGHAIALAQRGNVLQGLRRFQDAVASYDRAIALKPDYSAAYNDRGSALATLGHFEQAVASYEQAIALRPNDAEAFRNRGVAFTQLGRLDEAVASYDRAIAIKPGYADAFNDRAVALSQFGRLAEAIESCERAVALRPNSPEALSNRGNALNELNRFAEAVASYDRAIALKPDYADAHCNRGNALSGLKRFEDALASYERAIAIDPAHAEAVNNKGNALHALQRFDEALANYHQAIELKHGYADALNNRGNALRELKRFDDALASYAAAIALKPDHAEYHNNRAIVLSDLKRFEEALASYAKAIALKPDYAEAYSNRGYALRDFRRYGEAQASFAQALALKPDFDYLKGTSLHARMHVCDWLDFESTCEAVLTGVGEGKAAALPFQLLAIPASPEQQLRCARIYSTDKFQTSRSPLWRGERYAHDRIRVAYLSADLRDHPIATLTAGLFERHDRIRFETVAISFKSDSHNHVRERLTASFDRFVDAERMSDREVAALVRELEIDIAVDLNGYTEGCRPQVFALRPAPVHVNYLGFAGTLGNANWDYIIADDFVVPEHSHACYAENVVSLPDCFMANDCGRRISTRTPARSDAGLPDMGFVFCCFNNSFKITPDVFDVWMRLLARVPGSVLWLSAANASAVANLRGEAERRGIAAERLVFAQRVPLNEDHLARLRLADLFLDTLPYNAHTTAADALWAGVPVLTSPGETFASRVAGSLLTTIGLPELITRSLAEYETLALRLAHDPGQLAALRQKLARNRDVFPLFDTSQFTRYIEAAYATMWERTQRGEPPESFAVLAAPRAAG